MAILGLAAVVLLIAWPGDVSPASTTAPGRKDGTREADEWTRSGERESHAGPAGERGSRTPEVEAGARSEVDRPRPRGSAADTRRQPLSRSRGLQVVDLAAASTEEPAWPPGPRLLAEVETSTRRYVNLRPNQFGLMPTLRVAAGEALAVHLQLPDGEPGEAVFVELTDGGAFPDSPAKGRTLRTGADRRLSLAVQADARPGNCTLVIRQAGLNRVMPLWVGPPLEPAEPIAD